MAARRGHPPSDGNRTRSDQRRFIITGPYGPGSPFSRPVISSVQHVSYRLHVRVASRGLPCDVEAF